MNETYYVKLNYDKYDRTFIGHYGCYFITPRPVNKENAELIVNKFGGHIVEIIK